jgi:hypothetical protein
MIINNSHENGSGGYVGLMNAVFAAQKRVRLPIMLPDTWNSAIDCCIVVNNRKRPSMWSIYTRKTRSSCSKHHI